LMYRDKIKADEQIMPEKIEPAGVRAAAMNAMQLFVAFKDAGFTEAQALELFKAMLAGGMQRPNMTVSKLKQRSGDQPLPAEGIGPAIQDLVIADIQARKQVGIQRYGKLLQAHNGRDVLQDLYEELMDALMYCKQMMMERDGR